MDTEIRVATFNASLNRGTAGQLAADLANPAGTSAAITQAKTVAEIIQRANPDILLINEFDYDPTAAALFRDNFLAVSQNGAGAADYPYFFIAPSNTGVASGFDLNNNGVAVTTPGAPGYGDDSLGFGAFPGQFGMVIFSKYPIEADDARTFQNFLWKDMPGARLPDIAATSEAQDWYSAEELAVLPLSSKSHWDVPVNVNGEIVHVLAAHPTPPVFDGPEDRNGLRNADEIRFWDDYVTPGAGEYIYDDAGNTGGLGTGERFVIVGDYNADLNDGDSVAQAIGQLLFDPSVDDSIVPDSDGGDQQSALQGGANANHKSDPSEDTADFADGAPGNLRADYVLPSQVGIDAQDGFVFWPVNTDPLFPLVGTFTPTLPGGFPSSDHRLVAMDLVIVDDQRREVRDIDYLGEITFASGTQFDGTTVGGLSGIAYDAGRDQFYAISDDRSQFNPARFYTLNIDIADGNFEAGDVVFTDVTTLTRADGTPYPALSLDPESIALTDGGLFISSEGDANALVSPFVNLYTLDGAYKDALPVDAKFTPVADRTSGIRNNLAFESLTVTPDQGTLFTATENALYADGPAATPGNGSASRIVQYDLATGAATAEYIYITEPVAVAPIPSTQFATNGLVELLAIDNDGTLLAIERSFSVGIGGTGNSIKIFEVRTQGATNVIGLNAIATEVDDGELEANLDAPVQKELLFDLADLGIPLDNIEGISFGPKMADGRQSLILVSDNNFSGTQFTQFLAFAIELDNVPTIAPVTETPAEPRYDGPTDTSEGADMDDPAIWLNPNDPNDSRVVAAAKEGGLRVYDLSGNEVQEIAPEGIRYNNVDVLYNVALGGQMRDLFVASDRANDTLAVYAIDPATGLLSNVTARGMIRSIFGEDDGEATAYGLDTFTAADGTRHVFVTQADGDKVAQLKLVATADGTVSAKLLRTLELPNPEGVDAEDLQSEGIVVDDTTGIVYVAVEGGGIYRFSADPASTSAMEEFVSPDADFLVPDLEGLSIRYANDGSRQLFVSSQGDSTFSVLDVDSGAFLGRFAVADGNGIDGAEESDGLDIYSGALGSAFPNGLLVVHDGSSENQNVFADPEDGEIQNYDTNFKYVDLGDALAAIGIENEASTRDPRGGLSEHGVAAGEVTARTALLWANSTSAGKVRFEIATDADFTNIVRRTSVNSLGTEPVHASVRNLQDGTHYYYRAIGPAGDVVNGEFTTAHADGHNGLTFGVSGDWRGGLTPYSALSNADDAALDFFVQLGDTIYSDHPSPAFPGEQTDTLAEYSLKYEETLSTRGGENFLADLRASTAVYAMIDDHEVTNDFAGGAPANSDPRFDPTGADYINETSRYTTAMDAFVDYQPIEERIWSGTGDDRFDGTIDLYRTQNYGDDAAVFTIDARSFRDAELPDANITSPADIGRFLTQSFDPSRTMLGNAQMERLKADLIAAQDEGVLWKFIMVPEPIQNLGPAAAADRFEGYAAERTELLKFIHDHNISNVVFVAADIHGTLVNNLTYQESAFGPQIAVDAFEISTGAVGYSPALGQTIVGLAGAAGLISAQQAAFYASLPVANDADSIPNDKDDFLKSVINGQLDAFGYDRLGLNDNLGIADGLVDANLLQGDYVAGHSFGWTQFDIDAQTHVLTVTTYGIPTYSEADAAANPELIASLTPVIVSQFEVHPDQVINGSRFDETFTGGKGDDTINGKAGNDTLNGDAGDDIIIGGAGDDRMTGGEGADRFVQTGSRGADVILDFNFAEGDRLDLTAISWLDTQAEINTLGVQAGNDVLISLGLGHLVVRGVDIDDLRNAIDYISRDDVLI